MMFSAKLVRNPSECKTLASLHTHPSPPHAAAPKLRAGERHTLSGTLGC